MPIFSRAAQNSQLRGRGGCSPHLPRFPAASRLARGHAAAATMHREESSYPVLCLYRWYRYMFEPTGITQRPVYRMCLRATCAAASVANSPLSNLLLSQSLALHSASTRCCSSAFHSSHQQHDLKMSCGSRKWVFSSAFCVLFLLFVWPLHCMPSSSKSLVLNRPASAAFPTKQHAQ